jgi:hypothetical protein
MDVTKLLESLVGKTKEDAQKLCDEIGVKHRILREDSNKFPITLNIYFNRVNLYIDNNIVTKCDVG